MKMLCMRTLIKLLLALCLWRITRSKPSGVYSELSATEMRNNKPLTYTYYIGPLNGKQSISVWLLEID